MDMLLMSSRRVLHEKCNNFLLKNLFRSKTGRAVLFISLLKMKKSVNRFEFSVAGFLPYPFVGITFGTGRTEGIRNP